MTQTIKQSMNRCRTMTFAQRAYEAFCRSGLSEPIPWDDLPFVERGAFTAAAEAVVAEVTGGQACPNCHGNRTVQGCQCPGCKGKGWSDR